jgi:gliding motility-associated-like protein
LSNDKIATPSAIVTSDIFYQLIVTNGFGCSDTDAMRIRVYPQPQIVVADDTTVCSGTSFQIGLASGTQLLSYQWSPASGLSSAVAQQPDVYVSQQVSYIVTAVNEHGCTTQDSIAIDIIPFGLAVQPDKIACVGDTLLFEAIGGNQYVWRKNNEVLGFDAKLQVVPVASSVYTVRITNETCKKENEFHIPVNVHTPARLNIAASHIDCGVATGQLIASGAAKYSWQPAADLTSPTEAVTWAAPAISTRYILTATDDNGCVQTDSVELNVTDNKGFVVAPDAFTPNGDGRNDCYKVLVPFGAKQYQLVIANRFGNIVFETTDASACWDGTYNGQKADVGTYFFYYKITTDNCGTVFRKGDITLIR